MNLTVAMTGASGAVFGRQLLLALEADARVTHVNFVASESALRVIAEEMQFSGRSELLPKLLGQPPVKTQQLSETDVGANIASGSYPSNGMIVLPCSMGTLAGIANGLAQTPYRARRGRPASRSGGRWSSASARHRSIASTCAI